MERFYIGDTVRFMTLGMLEDAVGVIEGIITIDKVRHYTIKPRTIFENKNGVKFKYVYRKDSQLELIKKSKSRV